MKNKYFSFAFFIILLIFQSCSQRTAKIDNSIEKYFVSRNVEGCFTMLNNNDGKITVYNIQLDTTRFSPVSSFSILSSLIALQTGAVTDERMVIKWDGFKRENAEWNKDLNIKTAFSSSADPFFQEVARRIGKDTMQSWIDRISYGNKSISGSVDSIWLNNSLKISPDEQLGLLKRLYFGQLPFRKSVQEQVKQMLLREDNTTYRLSYQKGFGQDESGKSIGWLVGWIEENNHVYFFATFLKSKDNNYDMNQNSLAIVKDILKQYGFFEGKK
ncbi:MAG: class D beta-lactamase [Ferruginibacter sp.]|nr:class D beta-lactamase [Ferruginibacter sp.]